MRTILPSIACLSMILLTACAGGREDLATTACEREVKAKLNEQNYRIDVNDLRASAEMEDDKIMRLTSSVTFDAGLPREYKQAVECRVRFVEGQKQPNVISINFTW